MKFKLSILSSVIGASVLTGCGFDVEKNVVEPLPPKLMAQFIDSPVSGIDYQITNINGEVSTGKTDENGFFEYYRGDRVVFSVGELKLPEISPKPTITPLNFFTTDNPVAPQVANLARLLQSLDTDGNPDNGISISSQAAAFAKMPLKTDSSGNVVETVAEFFNRSETEFAAAIEPWLQTAVPENTNLTGLVSYDAAVAHFVKSLETNLAQTATNGFDVSKFTGVVHNAFVSGASVAQQEVTFTPSDSNNTSGTYRIVEADTEIETGSYEFTFGRRVLAMSYMEGDESKTKYLVSLAYDTQDDVYSVCSASDSMGVASVVSKCDTLNQRNINKLSFAAFSQTEIDALEEAALSLSIELVEDFNTTTDNFFTTGHKRLSQDLSSGALYAIASGSPEIVDGAFSFSGDRITIGKTTSTATTAADIIGQGIYNLSQGFEISFDVISADSEGKFYIYADNNTASQSNSIHENGISKLIQVDLATGETTEGGLCFVQNADSLCTPENNMPKLEVGKRVTYSYTGDAFDETKRSFIQLRAAGGTNITIDNLKIDTIAQSVEQDDVPDTPAPTGPQDSTTRVNLPFSTDFTTISGDLFSSATLGVDGQVDPTAAEIPMFTKTGGTVAITSSGLKITGGRFTLGNTETLYETAADTTVDTGVFNLTKPYNIVMDVIQTQQPTAGKNFQVYVDNNTSASSKSKHGGSSRIYNVDMMSVPTGTLTIPGDVGSAYSFIQLRAEGDSVIEINNLRIEYQNSFEPPIFNCADATSEIYYCDDFSGDNLDDWDINPNGTSDGTFDILELANGNKVMRYTAGGSGLVLATLKDSALANVPSADYFVEMKIRPRQNSTTASKHLYVLGRYQDKDNWYGAGLNMQNAITSTQAEVATNLAASLSRPVQQKKQFALGEKGATEDGVWYTVRYEVIGSDITLYVDGEKIGTHQDSTLTAKGLVGLYTNNRSFEVDDLKIGDPSVKPVLLATDFPDSVWTGNATGDALTLNITAVQSDGTTADTFKVESSDDSIASVTVNGNQVTITPLTQGNATIYLTSNSDASVVRTLNVEVGPAFNESQTNYGDLSSKISPAPMSQAQYIDSSLEIEFDSAPTLGTSGVVRIFNSADDSLVDEIKVAGEEDEIAKSVSSIIGKTRNVKYRPFKIEGNKLIVKPHNSVLEYGKEYYVVIGNDVVVNTQLNGVDFDGIGPGVSWSFQTRDAAPTGTDITVDDDGFADFRTLQGALNYAMEDKNTAMTITIKDGIYEEILFLRNKNNLTIQGESRDKTIVQYDNYEGFNGGSSGRPVFLVESADNLVLNNFTLKNTHVRTGSGDQAETIYFNSPYRLIANNMNFISEQDTLLMKGYNWFYNCLVAGNVDFIWGYSVATLFENSEIRTLGDSKNAPSASDGGYILQARVQDANYPGFVFMNNEFTSGPGPLGNTVNDNSTYIARSAGDSSVYDNIVLINNKLGPHMISSGWKLDPLPNPVTADATSGWREYGSMDLQGNPLDISGRVSNATAEADLANAPYTTRAEVFASYNNDSGWNPQPLSAPVIVDPVQATGDGGFASYGDTITGGANGTSVTVSNGVDLVKALDDAKNANTPVTIYIDGKITAANTDNANRSIAIKDMHNVSIIGVADRGEFDGIGLQIERAKNVIIQNLKIHEVPASFGDAIGIQSDQGQDDTSHIWIDHNELYGSLSVDKDAYDGLIDSRYSARNITVSYNYIHDHQKTMLNGSSDAADESGDRFITYHHNYFANIGSRVPLLRYGYAHMYNNYFYNITGSAINSRMGAEILVENNVFEDVKNPIVSLASEQVGYWNVRNNLFIGSISYSPASNLDLTKETTFEIEGQSTSTYEVPYDYQAHLMDPSEVKNYVVVNAGIGKIDQSGLTIPDVVDNGNSGNTGGTGATSGSTVEDFSAADRATFFSAAYKSMANDTSLPLYIRTGGGVDPVNGELVIGGSSGGRYTIGDIGDPTGAGLQPNGTFDLSAGVTISFKLVAAQNLDASADKSFMFYIDNNTSGGANSIHDGSSKFWSAKVSELTPQLGQTITIDTDLGTATSFIQVRSESNVEVIIDDLVITPKVNGLVEDFSAADRATFFSAAYKSLANDTSLPLYIRTGGGVDPVNGELVIGGSSGGRYTIGDIGDATVAAVQPNGTLDLSAGVTISFKLVAAQNLDASADKSFMFYIDNNTSGGANSIHDGSSKFWSAKVSELTPQIGQTITIDTDLGTAASFIQVRSESNVEVIIDDLVITAK
ncbi:pectinesterase family protein [Catenovulum maritimum]|uniref:Pectate lyase domain-containing protein n=1 Tax=Catenovulum maritimum TaxID=1513271 RepID=A0A0J8GZY0_9ALTE|nr:pectinesterase family protein [Catenovulum maritimum]KMT66789.1 hypothetical protein XM47_01320 [Catenovulum maritimum]